MGKDFEIITFDCYGTLIDWEGGIKQAFLSEAAKDGVQLDGGQIITAYMEIEPLIESGEYLPYREVLTRAALQIARRLNWHISQERAGFLAASLPTWQPFPDTNPALQRLAAQYRLGILSNIDDDLLALTRRHFPVDFDVIVTAQQVSSYKPGAAHFQEAKRRLGETPWIHAAQSYFHDVIPARHFRIPVIWVNRKVETRPPGGVAPTDEVPNLSHLADRLCS